VSLYDYQVGREIAAQDYPFYALLQAVIRRADSNNLSKLRAGWPALAAEVQARYGAPGGRLPSDPELSKP
jgi:hypothetical protein